MISANKIVPPTYQAGTKHKWNLWIKLARSERTMRRFKSAGHAQRFLAAHDPIREHFCPRRHRLGAKRYRAVLQERFAVWNTITGVQMAA
jgi:hypothetical protein